MTAPLGAAFAENQMDVEGCLIRFVKNNRIRQLIITFRESFLILTKGPKRSKLFVCTMGNFPSQTDVMRDKGYRV